MDRRAVFFLMAAGVCALLIPIVPDDPKHPKVEWIGPFLVTGYLILALLSWLDARGRRRAEERPPVP